MLTPPFIEKLSFEIILTFILLLAFARLWVLPIAYKKLENSQRFILISKFIQKLKSFWYLKLLVLIITYFGCWSYGFPWFSSGYVGQLCTSLIFGLLGSYLVLFAYWFIEDTVRNIIKKET